MPWTETCVRGSYPAISTTGLFLRNQNLTCPRKKRCRATPTEPPLTSGRYIDHVWRADFKGHFSTGDDSRCNPLTIGDHAYKSAYYIVQHLIFPTYQQLRVTNRRITKEDRHLKKTPFTLEFLRLRN